MTGLEQVGFKKDFSRAGGRDDLQGSIYIPENLYLFNAANKKGNGGELIEVVGPPTASGTFKDDPSKPPAVRAVEALINLERRRTPITEGDKAIFEDALKKADQEVAQYGVSPRFKALKERLDRLDSIREDLSQLPIETGIKFLALEHLRNRGPEAAEYADRELDKLVPGSRDGKTFSQRCKEVRDAGDLNPAGSMKLEANVTLEEREDEAVRAYYAKALSTDRNPANDKRARQIISDIQLKYPDAEWFDPVVKELLDTYDMPHRKPSTL